MTQFSKPDHPTPLHIKARIYQAISLAQAERSEYVPLWVFDAIDGGISQAIREHDEGRKG